MMDVWSISAGEHERMRGTRRRGRAFDGPIGPFSKISRTRFDKI